MSVRKWCESIDFGCVHVSVHTQIFYWECGDFVVAIEFCIVPLQRRWIKVFGESHLRYWG